MSGEGDEKKVPFVLAPPVEEWYFLGEIVGAVGFRSSLGVSCSWQLDHADTMVHLEGQVGGQTQTAMASREHVAWNHPIDAHLAAKAAFPKPKLVFQVNVVDSDGRSRLGGYGHCFLPTAPSSEAIEVPCWRPVVSVRDELSSFFLGNVPQLASRDVVASHAAWTDRCRLVTVPSGTIQLRVAVLKKEAGQ